MTLSDIIRAARRATELTDCEREKAGIERAVASILDESGVPATGPERVKFLQIFKGILP